MGGLRATSSPYPESKMRKSSHILEEVCLGCHLRIFCPGEYQGTPLPFRYEKKLGGGEKNVKDLHEVRRSKLHIAFTEV